MAKRVRYLVIGGLILLLVACSDATATVVTIPLPTTVPSTTAPRPGPQTSTPVPPTLTPLAVPPTFTPFRAPPTPTATPFILPTFTPTPSGPSLDYIARARASFKSAYSQVTSRQPEIEREGGLVLAQTSLIGPQRTAWTLYFVKTSQPPKMWIITFDTDTMVPTVNESQAPILTADAGQFDVPRILDTFNLIQRVTAKGFPLATPVDTVILQMYQTPDKKRIPAWFLVNTSFNRQLVVNAYTGDIIDNSFNR